MTPWLIMDIFEALDSFKYPTKEALQSLAESANGESPSDEWESLVNFGGSEYVDSMTDWLNGVYIQLGQNSENHAVFFLLEDVGQTDFEITQDIFAYSSKTTHDADSYENWTPGHCIGYSKNSVFIAISNEVDSLKNINGFSDYAIPLLFSGAVIVEGTRRLCEDRAFRLNQDIAIYVGYRYGDCFQLGKIKKLGVEAKMFFKLRISRLA